MLEVGLDKSGLDAVLRSRTSIDASTETFAYETGKQFAESHARLNVIALYDYLKEKKNTDDLLYQYLDKLISAGKVSPIRDANMVLPSLSGIPKSKALILSSLIQSPCPLKLSGQDRTYLDKAKSECDSLFYANDEKGMYKPFFTIEHITLKRDERKSWAEVLKPFRHSSDFLVLCDPYALRQSRSLADFIMGLVSRSSRLLEITLITKEEKYSPVEAEKLIADLASNGYTIKLKPVLYGSSASQEIHDRYALTDGLSMNLGSGFDAVQNSKVYRNCKVVTTGKFWQGSRQYQQDLNFLLELINKGKEVAL